MYSSGKTVVRSGWKRFLLALFQALTIYSPVYTQQRAPYRPTPEWGAPQDRLSGFAESSLGRPEPGKGVPMSCYDRLGKAQRCIPPFVNAAYNMEVDATSTCGRPPIQFCRQTGATGATQECDYCDSRSTTKSHPTRFLTDFWSENLNQTWWQSTTMLQGVHLQPVNLTLDLHKTFELTYVRLRFRTSVPESFAIYKRNCDNCPWVPYQYYSASCKSTYGVRLRGYVTRENEQVALCTDEFSDISPLTNGNVPFSTLESRPSRDRFNESMELQDWVTATAIKITLDNLNTFGDEVYGDPKVLRSYYYAISDLSVGARCKCNGHASHCVMSTGEGQEARLVCQCEHFTAGADCEKCLPFYQNRPWGKATDQDARVCEQCDCNGLSNRCVFDDELYRRTGKGGRCLDCERNTAGPHCEECKTGFYRAPRTKECVACRCDAMGSRISRCDVEGRCSCKPGVTGGKCDRCLPAHYGFFDQGCLPCSCDERGSVNNNPTCDVVTGKCRCKANVEGDRCNKCKPGFFNLITANEFGCSSCFCYGHSSVCSSAPEYFQRTILSDFRSSADGWTISGAADSEAVWNQQNEELHHGDRPSLANLYFVSSRRFTGDQRFSYDQKLSFKFRLTDGRPQASREDVVVQGKTRTISIPIFEQGNPMPSKEMQRFSFKLHDHPNFRWSPRLTHAQFIELLSDIVEIRIRASYSNEGVGIIDDVELESASHRAGNKPATHVEKCQCPKGYVGQFCEDCAPGFRRDVVNGGAMVACVPCSCNGHSPTCDVETGRCICLHNTEGTNCQRCARGYIGNSRNGREDDCRACPCPMGTACVQSKMNGQDRVICTGCPVGYVGPSCLMCGEGFYGDLTGCRPEQIGISNGTCVCNACRCNGNVDRNAIGNCDAKTGACLKCIYGTTGRHCERCLPGFYGVAIIESRHGNCTRCDCDPRGTRPTVIGGAPEVDCGVDGQCRCFDHVGGRRCDQPEPGFRWVRKGDVVEGLVDPEDPLDPRPLGPSLLPPDVFIEPPSSGFIGIPPKEAGYEIIHQITGEVVSVPRGGAMIVKIPPGARGYRVINGVSGELIDIPIGGSSWVVDPATGRVLGIPSRTMTGGGIHGLVDPDGSPRPRPLAPGLLPPGIIVRPPAGGFIGVPMKGSDFRILDPVTGKEVPVPNAGAIMILIPPGGGGYRLIDPITSRKVEVPLDGRHYVVDSASGRVIGIPVGSGDEKEALVDPDDVRIIPIPDPNEMIVIPGRLPWLPGTRFRPVLPCDCDIVGSLGPACSDDGQCLCKPGVEGAKCRKCAKGFYDLNAEGCRPCNCDPVGSLSSSCDGNGRCVCLENVVGNQCSQCKRNMFGLSLTSRQCFPCDPCYDLIDGRVEQHQTKLDRLKKILSSGGDRRSQMSNVTDDEMDKLVADVNETLNSFLSQALAASSTANHKRFVAFAKELFSLTSKLESIKNERILMLRSVEHSTRESRLLQSADEEIERLLSSLDDRLDALKDLLMDAKSLDGDSSKTMQALNKLGQDATKQAESHSNSARTIIDTAETASSMTNDAKLRLDESRRRVESVASDLARLRLEAQEAKSRVEEMAERALRNREMAIKALVEARQTAKEAKSHQPGISVVVSEKIAETMKNAKKIGRVSTDLRNANRKILAEVEEAEKRGNNVYQEALTQQQLLDSLLDDGVNIKMQALTARDQTRGILGEAQRTLETLSDFDNTVTSSKLETENALNRISEIEQLLDRVDSIIRDTNVKWRRSHMKKTVEKAVNQSKEAESLTSLLSINSSSLVTETSTTLKMATEIKLRSEKLISVEFQAAETQLKDMETTAENDVQKAEEAVSTTLSTGQKWRLTDVKADDVLWRLEAILDDLSRLGDSSSLNLEDLDRDLKAAESAVEDLRLDEKMARYEIGSRHQLEYIKSAEADFKLLEKEVINVEDIREALPPPERENCPQLIELEASRRK